MNDSHTNKITAFKGNISPNSDVLHPQGKSKHHVKYHAPAIRCDRSVCLAALFRWLNTKMMMFRNTDKQSNKNKETFSYGVEPQSRKQQVFLELTAAANDKWGIMCLISFSLANPTVWKGMAKVYNVSALYVVSCYCSRWKEEPPDGYEMCWSSFLFLLQKVKMRCIYWWHFVLSPEALEH